MKSKHWILTLSTLLLLLATPACNATLPHMEATASPAPTVAQPQPTFSPPTQSSSPQITIPLTEADVPRIEVQDAKAAHDKGEAVIVDVRSAESYAAGHAAGAINIPLDIFETNPSSISLQKDQWIFTYCT